MAYSNGIITKPISIDDIKIALGVWENRLSVLCKSPQINMWSRNKPMSIAKLFDVTESDKQNVNYGINISIVKGYGNDTLFQSFNYANQLTYAIPFGSSLSPYRLADFNGYNSQSIVPYGIERPATGNEKYMTSLYRTPVVVNNLLLEDLKVVDSGNTILLKDMYFGFSCKNISTGAVAWMTYSITLLQQSGKYDMMEIPLDDGDYQSVWFLSSVPKTLVEPDKYSIFVPLESGGFSIATPILSILTADFTDKNDFGDYEKVQYSLHVYNDSSSTLQLTNCVFHYRFADKSLNDALEAPIEKKVIVGTIDVAAGGYIYSNSLVNFMSNSEIESRGAKLYFTCTQTSYNTDVTLVLPRI